MKALKNISLNGSLFYGSSTALLLINYTRTCTPDNIIIPNAKIMTTMSCTHVYCNTLSHLEHNKINSSII